MPVIRRLVLAALLAAPAVAGAQQRPSPEAAQELLRQRPELVMQLRERIMNSGLTPAQVRARLRAEGYPPDLLDAYLSRTSSRDARPNADVLSAMKDLGLADSTDLRELMRLAGLDEEDGKLLFEPARLRIADSLALADSTLSPASAEVFGLALFRGLTSQFMPNLDGPVDANYRLGAGDELSLILTGDVELSHELSVARDGSVLIPDVGRVAVANLTLGELENLLYTRLGRVYGGIRRTGGTTAFAVNVTRLRSMQVFVTGDVMTPGSYRVTSAGTALTALYAAGGPTLRGSLRRVEVRRGGALVSTLDVYDYLVRGSNANDVRLQQGDILFVPVHGPRVRIDGEVMRPGTYEAKPGEGLGQLLEAAGGLRATAVGRRMVVERVLPVAQRTPGRDRVVIDVALGDAGAMPTLEAVEGDIVRVPRVTDRVRGRVLVEGHVWTEGPQGITPGLTLAEALQRAGGLKPDAYLGTVHVSRLQADSTRRQLRAMLRDSTGATIEPLTLAEDDIVTVYSRTDFRPDAYVAIGGAVKDGRRYPYREGMTLRDLVLMAGGLEENAYLQDAEVARLPAVRDARTTATTIRVPLDSSYRFELGSAVARTAAEFPLQPHDNVLILQDPDWRKPATVWVTGEVRFPGQYTLLQRDERLSSVVRRAGGLTAQAHINGAWFSRLVDTTVTNALLAAEERRLLDSVWVARNAAKLTAEDSLIDKDTLKVDEVRERLRVGIDLRDALARPGRADDLLLLDGDSIHLPPLRQTVSVRGAVNMPTALAHSGASLAYYLNAAGGPTERARARRAYVIQPNGKIQSRRYLLWLVRLDPTPLPGAAVVVPDRAAPQNQASTLATLSVVTQMLASLVTIIVISR